MRYLDINWRPVFWELAAEEGGVSRSSLSVFRAPLMLLFCRRLCQAFFLRASTFSIVALAYPPSAPPWARQITRRLLLCSWVEPQHES